MKYFLCVVIAFVLFCLYAVSLGYMYNLGESKGYVACKLEMED